MKGATAQIDYQALQHNLAVVDLRSGEHKSGCRSQNECLRPRFGASWRKHYLLPMRMRWLVWKKR